MKIEQIVINGHGSGVTVWTYVNGMEARDYPAPVREFHIDPGAGWTCSEWVSMGLRELADASSDLVREALATALDRASDWVRIEDDVDCRHCETGLYYEFVEQRWRHLNGTGAMPEPWPNWNPDNE